MFLSFLLLPVFCKVIELNWNIEWVKDVNPDSNYTRDAIGVNGKWYYLI